MKRTTLLNYAVLTVLAFLSSCQKVDISFTELPVKEESLYAIIEQNTDSRTYIDHNYNVCWQKSDQIAVFNKNTIPARYQIEDAAEGKTNGLLNRVPDAIPDDSFNAGTELAALVAYYPYTKGLDIKLLDSQESSYNLSGVIVPEIQKYDAKNLVSQNTLPMVSFCTGENKDIVFKNVCGVLELHFKGNFNIKTISLEALLDPTVMFDPKALPEEKISGEGTIFLNMNQVPEIFMDEVATTKITLDCSPGVQLDPYSAESFRIVVPPTIFLNGFKIGITDVDGSVKSLECKGEQKIQRSRILDMPDRELIKNTDMKTFTINNNGKGVSFTMVAVKGGTFKMGASANNPDGDNYDSEADSGESPVHEVTLTQDYYIGQTEVTQELWEAVMGSNSNPSYHTGNSQYPVEQVSWNDIVNEFLPKLNQLNLVPDMIFSLPTEAQWEYAARGGNQSPKYKYSGSNNVDEVAWCDFNYDGNSHEVATKKPNELGLIYDMSGNVSEWCADWYGDYNPESQSDPKGPDTGSERILRGGSYRNHYLNYCRVSSRSKALPDAKNDSYGFRLVLIPVQ